MLRALRDAASIYISTTWDQAAGGERSAVSFVMMMTIYRRRLVSSFRALRATFEHRLEAMTDGEPPPAAQTPHGERQLANERRRRRAGQVEPENAELSSVPDRRYAS